ncbi:hypothetical protein JOC86_000237 [Bacillus pakistanensis]|uniref:VOC domain-containing protein n=1 Tax=Rossellomorea pakistanensis TaxID=992288 RepID=A0ABS2N765_9BACI|nr:hypothetical protein [Bacillus pakistanensis]MBM7583700.1 hypothetical protein [Bacillus pakistanensis]
MLFHYHYWTPYLEETEKFYKKQGFKVHQRLGKYKGEFQSFNPPLDWDDFRSKVILFRIIEMKKGLVNITFGMGKRVKFDHIGFLLSKEEHDQVCLNAQALNWGVKITERRTFITTPYGFLIELQTHTDVIELEDRTFIKRLKILTKKKGLENDLEKLFGTPIESVASMGGEKVTIREAVIEGLPDRKTTDPNEVTLLNEVGI